ncbi:GNAT family N-acetyltransferase [Halorarius litoreus]|uniref:GNAT family N-acetyltransferase n=1 Tax=Halorarius litoreus TaxID=2962676 RepID=UPI0020CCEA7E|nr:GNAT family N-acetyltransferase [Halorarius litoreus]
MEFVVLGWPPDGPKLRLDWQRFSYAGKFVMTATGKAVVREGPPVDGAFADDVLAAVAFNADRTDPDTLWLRYVTVRDDRRGEELGPRLCAFVAAQAADQGFERVRIAVNNPFAYEALYKAGFGFTGRGTGLAELVLERPGDRSPVRYHSGLDRFRERELSDAERAFLDAREAVPPPVDVPT